MIGAAALLALSLQDPPSEDRLADRMRALTRTLIEGQAEDGSWRKADRRQSRHVSQALLVCQALLQVRDGPLREEADRAVAKALAWVTEDFRTNRDWRIIWEHVLGPGVFSRAKELGLIEPESADRAIRFNLRALRNGQSRAGSWSYTDLTGGIHTSFVTASGVIALADAREAGHDVDGGMLDRAAELIGLLRGEDGAFKYYHPTREGLRADRMPGSIARNPACELALLRTGRGRREDLRSSLRSFMEHYAALRENYDAFPGTHAGPYQIAPYYFFYGHYYAALGAVECGDDALRRETIGFLYSNLIDLDIAERNREDATVGFDLYHAAAYTLMTLRIVAADR